MLSVYIIYALFGEIKDNYVSLSDEMNAEYIHL